MQPSPFPALAWPAQADPAPVAAALQGVWARTLLETTAGRDTSGGVRWVQAGRWHGALSAAANSPPPREGPGAAHSVFQTPDRIVQTTLPQRQLAVWERLPGSQGRRIALARRDTGGRPSAECLLVCGRYLLHTAPGPDGGWRFAFGQLDSRRGVWRVEQASEADSLGAALPWRLQRLGLDLAQISGAPELAGDWEVLEWLDA